MSDENQYKNGMGVIGKETDEAYTPFYGVDPILEYIDKDITVWCPFDGDNSAFVQKFKERGNIVINSHIEDGRDFFAYYPEEDFDFIVSNPPYSMADKVLQRLFNIGKPFAMILPTKYIQSIKRVEMFIENGIQLLTFDKRMGFHPPSNLDKPKEGNNQSSSYFCWKMLPSDLVFKKLEKYERSLKSEDDPRSDT